LQLSLSLLVHLVPSQCLGKQAPVALTRLPPNRLEVQILSVHRQGIRYLVAHLLVSLDSLLHLHLVLLHLRLLGVPCLLLGHRPLLHLAVLPLPLVVLLCLGRSQLLGAAPLWFYLTIWCICTPAFGASTAPTFGSPTVSAFGVSSAPFSFGSTASFSQSASAFGSTPFGVSPSPFGVQSSPFGAQTMTPTFGSPGFGQSAFGVQPGGTRVAAYSPTPDVDGGTGSQPAGKLESISAMPTYKDKSHEELRWEDYQRGDKGGPNPSGQPVGPLSFSAPSQPTPFGLTGAFHQSAANPFSSTAPSNPFAIKPPSFASSGFGSTSTSLFGSPFTTSSSSPFGSTPSTSSLFGAPTGSAFGASSASSPFGGAATSAFGSTSLFGSSLSGSSSAFGNTQPSGLFQSSVSPFGQTSSPFGPSTGFQQTSSAFGSNLFSSQSTGFGGSLFSSSTPSLFPSITPAGFGQTAVSNIQVMLPSLQTPFQSVPVAPTSSSFSFANFGQAYPTSSGGFGGISNSFNQGIFGQSASSQSNMVMQPAPVANPFGTLPAMPQMSIGRLGSTPSIQYGISSMPVSFFFLEDREHCRKAPESFL
ncbi:hypothetical protein GW17_00005250, partial [Ensete ventricosum]